MTMPELAAVPDDATGKFLRTPGDARRKIAGRHRAPSRQGKATAREPVQAPAVPAASAQPGRIVFVDETAVKSNLGPARRMRIA